MYVVRSMKIHVHYVCKTWRYVCVVCVCVW